MKVRRNYLRGAINTPKPISFSIDKRVGFNEVDPMGIVWYGRYAVYFEEAQRELGRRCGLSCDEEFKVKASLSWTEGAKIRTEYEIIKRDKSIATRGYTVQVLIDLATNERCIISPKLLEKLRRKWAKGSFQCLS